MLVFGGYSCLIATGLSIVFRKDCTTKVKMMGKKLDDSDETKPLTTEIKFYVYI